MGTSMLATASFKAEQSVLVIFYPLIDPLLCKSL